MNAEWCENLERAAHRDAVDDPRCRRASPHARRGWLQHQVRRAARGISGRQDRREKPWTYQANFCKGWRAKQEDLGKTVVTVKELTSIIAMARSLALDRWCRTVY
jgi:hypothetical protein